MLFGPAYKGIALATDNGGGAGRAITAATCRFAFNRKEAKDHGEGGMLIGAPLQGRVLIVDDVISAGTATRESLALIREHGAEPAGVLIALDRQERGQGNLSAAQDFAAEHGIPVIAIARLDDLLAYAADKAELRFTIGACRISRALRRLSGFGTIGSVNIGAASSETAVLYSAAGGFPMRCALVAVLQSCLPAASRADGHGAGHNATNGRDGQGNLHYDDALPDEALKFGYDVVSAQGLVVKHVDRASTSEEKLAAKAELQKPAARETRRSAQSATISRCWPRIRANMI